MSAASLSLHDITAAMISVKFPLLSERECEILHWIIESKTDPEIAGILGICVSTVSRHVHHILGKLHVENRRCAANEAIEAILCARPPRKQ
jgi:DNA-binding NarL/FixJ family response regulator